MIVKALYGLKSSGARQHEHMAQTLRDLGYSNCRADPDVWMKAKSKADKRGVLGNVLNYSDDILVMSHEPKVVMEGLMQAYTLKERSVARPKSYLGADIAEHVFQEAIDPGTTRWSTSSDM
jgi:hypothetical protein